MEYFVEIETFNFGKIHLKAEQIISDNPGVDGYFMITEKPQKIDLIPCFFESIEEIREKVREYDHNFNVFHRNTEKEMFIA